MENIQDYAEWVKRLGHHVIKTDSCYWYNAQPGFYFYFPYNRLIAPSKKEVDSVLWGAPCIGIRYFTTVDQFGKESYLITCEDKNYDLTSVDASSARRQTRRGLENFDIKPVEFMDLSSLGLSLIHDTLTRQGRNPNAHDKKSWESYCLSANGLEGFQAWGAFYGDRLASFMVTCLMEDHLTILHHSSATEYLNLYPNNALVFYVTKLKLSSPGVNAVSYGPQSLDAPESLDIFKFRMGYKKKPMKQVIVFNPVIKPFINSLSQKIIEKLSELRPENDIFRKLAGIIQFFRMSV